LTKLHLDSEYRRRWEEYHTLDGKVFDSRKVNWREINWERVIKLVASIEGHKHELKVAGKPSFRFFMRFRWGGQEAQYRRSEYIGHKTINIWTIGWSDGVNCFLKDIDFYTGRPLKEYKAPITQLKQHIHPRVKCLLY